MEFIIWNKYIYTYGDPKKAELDIQNDVPNSVFLITVIVLKIERHLKYFFTYFPLISEKKWRYVKEMSLCQT